MCVINELKMRSIQFKKKLFLLSLFDFYSTNIFLIYIKTTTKYSFKTIVIIRYTFFDLKLL